MFKLTRINIDSLVASSSSSSPQRNRPLPPSPPNSNVSRRMRERFFSAPKSFAESESLVVEPRAVFSAHFCPISRVRRRSTAAAPLPIRFRPPHHLWLIVFCLFARISGLQRVGGQKPSLRAIGGRYSRTTFSSSDRNVSTAVTFLTDRVWR